MSLPDISLFYDESDNALSEHADWLINQEFLREMDFIVPLVDRCKVGSVVEFGPGSGLLAHALKCKRPELLYRGIERSAEMLRLASSKELYPGDYSGLTFLQGDVREDVEPADLAMAFSFLKHFALDEWDIILQRVLASGRYAAFDMQHLPEDKDLGTVYPHVYVRHERLKRILSAAGHRIVQEVDWGKAPVEEHGEMTSVAYWTERIS